MAKKRKSGLLMPWSYSKLSAWEKCPLQARLQYIDKIPQPPSAAMDAGNAIHKSLERYVKKEASIEDVREACARWGKYLSATAEKEVQKIRTAYPKHEENCVENKWGFSLTDAGLVKCKTWFENDVWLRAVADVVLHTKTLTTVYDYKTGKVYPDHEKQGLLYAWAVLSAYPEVKKCEVKFLYVETGQLSKWRYTRSLGWKGEAATAYWGRKVAAMNADTEYKATPNKFCNWCAYQKYCPERGGKCPAWKGGFA